MDGPVLLVDDHSETTEILSRLLEARGMPVVALSEGLTAVKLIHGGFRPRVLVADQRMPDISGAELVRVLRSRPGGEDIWVLVLSASPLEVPVDARVMFRQKPIEPDTFVELVERLAREADQRSRQNCAT